MHQRGSPSYPLRLGQGFSCLVIGQTATDQRRNYEMRASCQCSHLRFLFPFTRQEKTRIIFDPGLITREGYTGSPPRSISDVFLSRASFLSLKSSRYRSPGATKPSQRVIGKILCPPRM